DQEQYIDQAVNNLSLALQAKRGQIGIANSNRVAAEFRDALGGRSLPVQLGDPGGNGIKKVRRKSKTGEHAQFIGLDQDTFQANGPRTGFQVAPANHPWMSLWL